MFLKRYTHARVIHARAWTCTCACSFGCTCACKVSLIILDAHVGRAVSDVESGDASDSASASDAGAGDESDSDSCCGYDGPNRDAGNLNQ